MFITIKTYRKQGIVQQNETNESIVATMETTRTKIDQSKSPTLNEIENLYESAEVYKNIGGSDQSDYLNFYQNDLV